MPLVPRRGYNTPPARDFDRAYTALLRTLQAAFAAGGAAGQAMLDGSVEEMRELTRLARALVKTPRPGGGGNYCPCFRFAP